jgi:hypothetical protein
MFAKLHKYKIFHSIPGDSTTKKDKQISPLAFDKK